jgi:glutathione S-transferase
MSGDNSSSEFYQGSSVYQLVGGDGSPYSCKMRALLRYRRIPFKWTPAFTLNQLSMWEERFPKLKAKVIPVLVRPDGSYANDSTLLILELEKTFKRRSVIPKSPAVALFAVALFLSFD